MTKSKIILHSLGHAFGVLGYISLIAFFLTNLEGRFPTEDKIWMPISMLLLLVLSASIMGVLVFGRPILLFLEGAKKQAVEFLAYTLGWILLMIIIIFSLALLFWTK